jgi:GT2 family glycosyltransferase
MRPQVGMDESSGGLGTWRMGFDVCVVTYRNSADRIAAGLRPDDILYVHDNTGNNLGFGAGANRAARIGSSEAILFVNPDGDLDEEALNNLERAVWAPGVIAVSARQGQGRELSIHRMRRYAPELKWLPGACLAVRRQSFERVGGFEERLFMYGEDVDLSIRLAKHGRIAIVNTAIFRHDDDNRSRRSFRMQHYNARNWLTVLNWHGYRSNPRVVLDAIPYARCGQVSLALARVTGALEYYFRTRHWPRVASRGREPLWVAQNSQPIEVPMP